MLYVFHGTDTARLQSEAAALVRSLGVEGVRVLEAVEEGEDFGARLRRVIHARGLFGEALAIPIQLPSDSHEEQATLEHLLPEMVASENHLICTFDTVTPALLGACTTHGAHVYKHDQPVVQKKQNYALSDAFFSRNRRDMWVAYERALRSGDDPHALHGLLAWALKSMLVATVTKSAEEAAMKPFVYRKAASGAVRFSLSELTELSRTLTVVYHEAHRGTYELDVALERWILRV